MTRSASRIDDELLVLRCQAGEADACELLVRRFEPRLRAHAWRLTGCAEAARDVLQEAWLGIVRGLAGLDDPARFAPWAYRIVGRRAADWVRRRSRRRRREAPEGDAPEPAVPAGADTGRQERLRAAIACLSAERQALLALYYVEELSVAEIAEALEVPAGTVKSRLYHTRLELKQVMEGRS